MIERLKTSQVFANDVGFTYVDTTVPQPEHCRIMRYQTSANRVAANAAIVMHGTKLHGSVFFSVNFTEPSQSGAWVGAVVDTCREQLGRP